MRRTLIRSGSTFAIAAALSGCVSLRGVRLAPGEEPTLSGPSVRDNRTPMDPAFACFASELLASKARRPVIAVGDVRDFTGKYSVNEGTAITQGGALMVSSALGKLGGAVAMAERFDPTIAERELGYVDRRQLGDGQVHSVGSPAGPAQVAWLPYFGGSIAASDFYIVGGITELNYDIRSGGAELRVGQVGPKARTYTQSVAIDLRIVDTRSLLVVRTVSLTKQFAGYEVGFNTFRFFGSQLFDINLGAKAQEPLQLGIRTALEEATLELVGAVTGRDPAACIAKQSWLAPPSVVQPAPALPGVRFAGVAINAATATTGQSVVVPFEQESDRVAIAGAELAARITAARKLGAVDLVLTAHDTETADPAKRHALTDRRIAALMALLRAQGIGDAIRLVWRPGDADSELHREGPGFQRIARLSVG
ncbi:MAG: CsgG/HfaB family protein [Pseudomonadota bacterium]